MAPEIMACVVVLTLQGNYHPIGIIQNAGSSFECGIQTNFRFLYMWPNSRISVMGGEQAAMVLTTVQKGKLARSGQTMPPEMEEAIKAPIIERYVQCHYIAFV